MECVFCAQFADSDYEWIITENDGWVLLPTIGCFTPGYCLFMPLDHIDAAADMAPTALVEIEAMAEQARALIEDSFGPAIIAEHGSRDCRLGAACCTHCHLHVIPVPDPTTVATTYRATGGDGTVLAGLADLPDAVDGPYLYLSPRPGEHLLWPAGPRFPRQYVRRVCADHHGIAGLFDWRDHPFEANRRVTRQLLRPAWPTAA